MSKPSIKITSNTIKSLIAIKYGAEKWAGRHAVFFELRDGTGIYAGQSMDAFVMDLWPSGKLSRYAFEVKISRSDFLHELKQPDKRKWAMDISNEFWFVCAPGVAKPEEIPEDCGLMVCSKNAKNLRRVTQAKYREAIDLDLIQVAAIMRSAFRKNPLPDTLSWKYAGQEITKEMLDELIADRRDYEQRAEIKKQVDGKIATLDAKRTEAMVKYAEELRKHGIEPPRFMFPGDPGTLWSGTVEEWVKEHFVTGPSRKKLQNAARSLRNAQNAVKSATEQIQSISGDSDGPMGI